MKIKAQGRVRTREAVLELERQTSDAESKHKTRNRNRYCRETAETERVTTRRKLKSEQALCERLPRKLEVQEQNKQPGQ